jgi:radical SAM protein with 4Fe4S-binding SPASM domain
MLRTYYDELRGWVGVKTHGILYAVDLINFCANVCPSCPNHYGKHDGNLMSINTFREIFDKAQEESKVRRMQLYVYSDSALHPKLHQFVAECTKRGIESAISTPLQTTKCDWAKVVEARPTELRVSFAGWKNMDIYQPHGRVARFEANMKLLSKLPRHPETRWTLFFHKYKDNLDEVVPARKFAEYYGFDFIDYPAIFMTQEKIVEKNYTARDLKTIDLLLESPEHNIDRIKTRSRYCQLQSKQIMIDANADVYLCQILFEDRFIVGNFLDTPLKELRRRLREHPFCKQCKNVRAHNYQSCYSSPIEFKDPIERGNKGKYK